MKPIDPSRPSGFYYVGFITKKSLDSMPTDEMRAKWPLGNAMNNTKPFASKTEAQKAAKAHFLRDVTIIEN